MLQASFDGASAFNPSISIHTDNSLFNQSNVSPARGAITDVSVIESHNQQS